MVSEKGTELIKKNSNKKKILILVGTRPNFIKVTQFKKVAQKYDQFEVKIVHTGQHFDRNMADVFFEQLNIMPDFFLEVESDSPNSQIANIMLKLENLVSNEFSPDLLIVPGDVNSTLAGALVANKLGIKLAHLESGLRSFDRSMPEEINRILTDEISDYCFTTEPSGTYNLQKQDKSDSIFFVGNTMIDTLVAFDQEIKDSNILKVLKLTPKRFILVTIHRPSNVDNIKGLLKLLDLFFYLSQNYALVFPIHPRTQKRIHDFGLEKRFNSISNLILLNPLGYFDFQKLVMSSSFILTDSGGIQEESTFRKVPCITLRDNTERPITIEKGSNTLAPFELEKLKEIIDEIEEETYKKGEIPELWDGNATLRIFEVLETIL